MLRHLQAHRFGPKPDSGDIIVGPDGTPSFDYTEIPVDGTLWFDTRQGRLFISFENEWYQTNGADGFSCYYRI